MNGWMSGQMQMSLLESLIKKVIFYPLYKVEMAKIPTLGHFHEG